MTSELKDEFLILVHPGSACGSADFNLGSEDASLSRERLTADLNAWNGAIAVIDGRLSRQLGQRRYYALGTAIGGALHRARERGLFAQQIHGEDDTPRDQVWATLRLIETVPLHPDRHRIELTGAWYNDDGVRGCVNDVRRALARRGFEVRVRPSAVNEMGPNPNPALMASSDEAAASTLRR